MKVLLWSVFLLCGIPWITGHRTPGPEGVQTIPGLECNRTTPCFEFAKCILGECGCLPGYQFEWNGQYPWCKACPEVHNSCDQCCYPANTTECRNKVCSCKDNNDSYACSILYQRDQFKLATEIALGAALAMAIVTIMALVWRTCSRRRQLSRGNGQRERNSSTASMTSVQLLVAQRMRDRPPLYNDRRHIRIEKPPAYEDALNQGTRLEYQFPPQTEDSTNQLACSSFAEQPTTAEFDEEGAVGGLTNPTFIIADESGGRNGCDKSKDGVVQELHM